MKIIVIVVPRQNSGSSVTTTNCFISTYLTSCFYSTKLPRKSLSLFDGTVALIYIKYKDLETSLKN